MYTRTKQPGQTNPHRGGRPRRLGLTLAELLVAISVTAVLLGSVLAISLQATHIFATTGSHISPQNAQMLAMRRVAKELRQAMLINTAPSTGVLAEVVLPKKDPVTGFNQITENPVTHELGLTQGDTIRYFLGVQKFPNAGNHTTWYANPDSNGNALFRADNTTPLTGSGYLNASVIIAGINSLPMVPDPTHPASLIPCPIFAFWPCNDNGTPNNPTDDTPTVNTRLIRITTSINVTEKRVAGAFVVPHTLSTQFYLRNLQTSQ